MSSCNGGSGGSPMGGKGSCSDVEVLHSHAVFECTSPISQTYSGHFSLCSLNSCTHRIKAFLNVTCPQVTFFIYWGSNAFFLLWLRISNCGFNNKVFANLSNRFLPKKRSRYFGIYYVYWWSLSGSNRWPPACKAGALPAELKPHVYLNSMVGLNGLEPTTSPLSGVRSNHLSYRPVSIECPYIIPWDI